VTPEQTEVIRWLHRHGFRVISFDPTTGVCALDLSALTPSDSTETER
jgi:hypothetical protein